ARWHLPLVGYTAVAAAILLKGPIGFVLPAAVVAVYLLTKRDSPAPNSLPRWLGLAHSLGLWWGVPLIALLVLPWFFSANTASHGEFFQVFFWKHNVERGLGGGDLPAHPWWFYGPRLFFDLLPWSPLLLPATWLLCRHRAWHEDPEARFGLIWLVIIVLVLSCARFKRADYLLPVYPGGVLLL